MRRNFIVFENSNLKTDFQTKKLERKKSIYIFLKNIE